MHSEYFRLQLDRRILQVFSFDKVMPTKDKAKIFFSLKIQIEGSIRHTSSFRFCRRFARSSILRSKRSTRIAFAPFNLVTATFESTA